MQFGVPDKSLKLIVDLIGSYTEVEMAMVFGSRAMGNFKNGSDVDIALFGSEVTTKIAIDISASLNEKLPLPYHFDAIGYSSNQEESLKKHIDDFGKIMYSI